MQSFALGINCCAFLSNHPQLTISCSSSSRFNKGRRTNFYKVLSLDSDAVGSEEIKMAYRRMARRCHPDVCPPSRKEEFTRKFLEIRRAYETLSDPIFRKSYDSELKTDGKENRLMHQDSSEEVWEIQLDLLRKRSCQREKARSPVA